jgi:predicted dehydrogenase
MDAKREKPLCVYPATGEAFVPKLPEGDGYEHEIKWFMDVLCGKPAASVITPEQSCGSVRIVDAEKKSAKTGKAVRVESSKV